MLEPSSVGKNNVSMCDSKTTRRARAEEKFRVKFLEKRSIQKLSLNSLSDYIGKMLLMNNQPFLLHQSLVKFSRQIIFSLAMATKTVAAWSTDKKIKHMSKLAKMMYYIKELKLLVRP